MVSSCCINIVGTCGYKSPSGIEDETRQRIGYGGFLKWGTPKPWVSIWLKSNFGWFIPILGNHWKASSFTPSGHFALLYSVRFYLICALGMSPSDTIHRERNCKLILGQEWYMWELAAVTRLYFNRMLFGPTSWREAGTSTMHVNAVAVEAIDPCFVFWVVLIPKVCKGLCKKLSQGKSLGSSSTRFPHGFGGSHESIGTKASLQVERSWKIMKAALPICPIPRFWYDTQDLTGERRCYISISYWILVLDSISTNG